MDQLINNFNIEEGYSQLASKELIEYLFNNFTLLSKTVNDSTNNTAVRLVDLGVKVAFANIASTNELGNFI
ncbi:MAG: hypothetical protein MTP17_03805 [Candidatus Midichloria sp.]|nr:MAG: hypothetical protein MTP17_03805 [Candidatus Midichloria sp.]